MQHQLRAVHRINVVLQETVAKAEGPRPRGLRHGCVHTAQIRFTGQRKPGIGWIAKVRAHVAVGHIHQSLASLAADACPPGASE